LIRDSTKGEHFIPLRGNILVFQPAREGVCLGKRGEDIRHRLKSGVPESLRRILVNKEMNAGFALMATRPMDSSPAMEQLGAEAYNLPVFLSCNNYFREMDGFRKYSSIRPSRK
jgi:hypothetical protein